MLLPLLPQLLILIGPLAGAIVGALAVYVVGVRKSKVDLRVAEMTIQTQREIAEGQRKIQIDIDRDRQNRQKIEEAYGHLMGWIYEIEVAIEDICSGLSFGDEAYVVKCMRQVDDWSWETIRPPKYTAATSYLWSDSVRDLLGETGKPSAAFSGAALRAYCIRLSPEVMRKCVGSPRAERIQECFKEYEGNITVWTDTMQAMAVGRAELLSILNKVQNQVRQEMLSSQVD